MPARAKNPKKVKVGVSLDPTLHAWAMARVGPGKEFSTLTHAIERALALLAERETRVPVSNGESDAALRSAAASRRR